MSEPYTVIGVWDDAAGHLIVAGVLQGEHSCVDSDDPAEDSDYTRFAASVDAGSWQEAVDLIREEYGSEE